MARINEGMMTSNDDKARTPLDLFESLNSEFKFDIDVCASRESALCEKYWTPEDNCLEQVWAPMKCYMNPPYGKQIPRFVEKACFEAKHGATVVCLLSSRTDTRWFHDWCWQAAEWRFMQGRLTFGKGRGSGAYECNAPFPSVIVIFKPKRKKLIITPCDRLGRRILTYGEMPIEEAENGKR